MASTPTLYVLDGSYYIFRGFYAVRHLTNSKGFPTNGLFAFTNMLIRVIEEQAPEYLVVAFDPRGDSFRNEIYAEYKANRSETPEDLVPQLPYFRDIVSALKIPILEEPGIEADDMIGSLVQRGEREGIHVVILSADKDLYQLLDDDTVMVDAMRQRKITVADVRERFQVEPEQVPDVLGLAGDTSDNIPGVPGIGEKTGGKLIKEFGSVENLLEHIDDVSGKKRKQNLREFRDQALLSKRLATIKTDVPIEVDLEKFKLTPPDFDAFETLCAELEFARMPGQLRAIFADETREEMMTKAAAFDYRAVMSAEELARFVDAAGDAEQVAVSVLLADPDEPRSSGIVGLALAHEVGQAIYVPVGHTDLMAMGQLSADAAVDSLRALFEDASVAKVTHDAKALQLVLGRFGVQASPIAVDSLLAAYLLDPNRHSFGLDLLAREYLQHSSIALSELTGTGRNKRTLDALGVEEATPHGAETADVTLRLATELGKGLDRQEMRSLHDEVELPLAQILAQMERTGIRVDTGFLGALSEEFAKRVTDVEQKVWDAAGEEFTINSPKQLRVILFDNLGLRVVKRGKSGPSTDQSVLEELSDEHPICDLVLQYRQLNKLQSTYVDALPRLVDETTGRIHTSFNQAVAATGRLSSSNPNLQNIPIRTEEGRRIRKAFVPQEGWTLIGGDYSQIELRILAHMSQEPVLLDAFRKGEDIHRRTAAEVFEVEPDEVTIGQRAAAKTINFGLIYGMGSRRLARDLGISTKEATAYIERYFERIGHVKGFFDGLVDAARQKGYAETLIGRRRPIPELRSSSRRQSALGERLAVNTPIQGSAADLIKLAMIRVARRLSKEQRQTRMLLQVHDELVFEAPPEEVDDILALAREEMEGVMELDVPLKVDLASGATWAGLK